MISVSDIIESIPYKPARDLYYNLPSYIWTYVYSNVFDRVWNIMSFNTLTSLRENIND